MKRTRWKKSKQTKTKENLERAQKALVIKTYGSDCYTCPNTALEGKNRQLGHVPWPRSILSTPAKYDIRFTRIQCMVCNIHRGGMGAIALQKMKDEGTDTDALWQFNLDTKNKVYPLKWYEEKRLEYETSLREAL